MINAKRISRGLQPLYPLSIGIALVGLSAMAFSGCGFTNNKIPVGTVGISGTGTSGGGGTGGAVTFSQVDSQIFQPLCVQCHGPGANPDLSSYGSFATNSQWISPGNPTGSAVYNAVASGAMPQGGPALSANQLSLLSTWIQEGAPND